ncbi:MAG: hypothetical protein J6U26_05815, partial [Lachnospiraceae bacterium]|nr:hypothetical protein [Lachnospiraceae bacterium]
MKRVRIELPGAVKLILDTLGANGEEAYAVGGCVRDAILGRKPNDWDITTSAAPEKVRACFRRTIATGIEHGTVTVMIRGTGYEVTTYRIDGAYRDHRHPDRVTFTPELSEDLRRRDFTVNAMAYNPQAGLVDLFHGREDLERGVIRAVGDPEARFSEDALRIVRAVRFAAQLGFIIDRETYRAAAKLSPEVRHISRERVREELMKTLTSPSPGYADLLYDMGILQDFYPEYGAYRAYRKALMKAVPRTRTDRLSAFFMIPPAALDEENMSVLTGTADRVLGTLKFDNDTRRKVLQDLRFSGETLEADGAALRILLWRYGPERIKELVAFHRYARCAEAEADRTEAAGQARLEAEAGRTEAAEQPCTEADKGRTEAVEQPRTETEAGHAEAAGQALKEPDGFPPYRDILDEISRILEAGECIGLKGLAVGGNDLTA